MASMFLIVRQRYTPYITYSVGVPQAIVWQADFTESLSASIAAVHWP